MPDGAPHLMIAYDGSDPATEAIAVAARLFGRSAEATVLYVCELMDAMPIPAGEAHAEDRAERLARTGAQRARALGLAAEARVEYAMAPPWRAIVDAAARDGADLIVMGTRGVTGVRSLLMGSSTRHVAQHALTPVLIVPDLPIADARRASARANGPAER
jgi:nucleotide-binding universal stress UspA family protein